jgi:methyl-accepting chemotaxis protein
MTDQLPATPRSEPKGAALDLLHIARINEEIKSVVAVAFKINIMALNAIFLAKRAGTAARGFGVLSNELRSFSSQLRETMLSFNSLIHGSVEEVSMLLQESRYNQVLSATAVGVSSSSRLHAVMERRNQRTAECRSRLSTVRRSLRMSIDDGCRLVELGGVLAKSAKIEAAYGAGFSASLSQVSGEFDGVVEEIRVSLDTLRRSSFFKG